MNPELLPILEAANDVKCVIFDLILDEEGNDSNTPTMLAMRKALNGSYNDLLKVRHGVNDHIKVAFAKSYCQRVTDFITDLENAPGITHDIECQCALLGQIITAAKIHIS